MYEKRGACAPPVSLPSEYSESLVVLDTTVGEVSCNGGCGWSLFVGYAAILLGLKMRQLSVLEGLLTQFLGLDECEKI